jgi:pantoate kinase
MMTTAFSPGHLTCFFQPMPSEDPDASGSRGAGFRLSLGTEVAVSEYDGPVDVVIDGVPSDAPVSRMVASILAPGAGFRIRASNGLPVGQGFGMSASGAVALALCICDIIGLPESEAYRAAHVAEVECGGGLGDVAGIMCSGHQPVRVRPGIPPDIGKVEDTGIRADMTLAVLEGPLSTGGVLSDPVRRDRIADAGRAAVDAYIEAPSYGSVYSISNDFSRRAGLETPGITRALDALHGMGYRAGMCMLGHSIFTDAPEEKVRCAVPGARTFRCSSTDRPAVIIRRG